MKEARWRWRYDYQAASFVVYRGGKRLSDFYPTKEAAQTVVDHLNEGGSIGDDSRPSVLARRSDV